MVQRVLDGFSALASAQAGVVSRAQLRAHGWTRHHVRSAIAAGRWAAFGQQAVVLHRGPLTTRQQWWVAVLNAGPTATLAGLTAAEELGLSGFETPAIHLVVRQNSWVHAAVPGVKVHVSRRFALSDRHPARSLPTVRIDRALVDAATWTTHRRLAAALIIAGVQQRLTRPDRLRAELVAAGLVRHRRLLFGVLDDVEGGTHALSELDLVGLCRRHSLPRPEQQRRRYDGSGRIRYLDATFRRPDGRVLNLEVDGGAHLDVLDAWADMDRDMALLVTGEPTVRVPSAILRSDPTGVAERIRRLLEAPW